MKVIIAGSRSIHNQYHLEKWLTIYMEELGLFISEVVSGGAVGIDGLGEAWATEQGLPIKRFIPDWTTHGKAAGPRRNRQMAGYADALVAFWDGESRGTKNMIEEALKRNLKLYVVTL